MSKWPPRGRKSRENAEENRKIAILLKLVKILIGEVVKTDTRENPATAGAPLGSPFFVNLPKKIGFLIALLKGYIPYFHF